MNVEVFSSDHAGLSQEGKSPWENLTASDFVNDLLALQKRPENSIAQTLADLGVNDDARASVLARQIKHETATGRTGNFATITVGNRPHEAKYTFFFENGGTFPSTGMRKLIVPCNKEPDLIRVDTSKQPRILFVNANSPEYPVKTAPLGIITLGAHLKRVFGAENVDVDYIDMQIESPDNVLAQINETLADIAGISVKIGGTTVMDRLLREMRGRDPDRESPMVVLGNALPTYASDHIHHTYPGVICVIGRGEYAMERLTRYVIAGKPPDGFFTVPGASFVVGKTIFQTESRPFNPSDFGVADWGTFFQKYKPSGYQEKWAAEASVGCPQKDGGVGCKFCAILPHGDSRGWLPFPEERVIDEMRTLALQGISHIRLPDEEFAAGKPLREFQLAQRLVHLKQELSSQGVRMPTFDFAMRVDDVFKRGAREQESRVIEGIEIPMSNNYLRREALRLFKEAGLTQIYLGFESGSADQLKRMYKAVTPQDNKTAIRILRELGIQIAGGWIMIDPEMKGLDDLKENIAFIEEMDLIPQTRTDDFITNPLNRMRVLEGSPLVAALERKGLLRGLKENMVEYNFEYEDPIIGAIAAIMEMWEEEVKPLTYAVKNAVANAALNPDLHVGILDKYFFRLKKLDFELIKAIVGLFDHSYPAMPADEATTELIDIFRQQRGLVLGEMQDALQSKVILDQMGTVATGFQQITA